MSFIVLLVLFIFLPDTGIYIYLLFKLQENPYVSHGSNEVSSTQSNFTEVKSGDLVRVGR